LPSDKDVLGKADALLRRHSVAPPADGSQTGGVPVLTELVDAPAPEAPPPVELSSPIAQDVFTRVMAEVEGRLSADFERRFAQHLLPEVHAAVASAIDDLRQELANAIGDAVAEALARRNVK
jgi:hypothetical protein